MKKIFMLLGAFLFLTACTQQARLNNQVTTDDISQENVINESSNSAIEPDIQADSVCRSGEFALTFDEAKDLVQEKCEYKEITENKVCNENTGTWWIDVKVDKPGCSPACVINLETKEAEVNWRCTGLITE